MARRPGAVTSSSVQLADSLTVEADLLVVDGLGHADQNGWPDTLNWLP